jgi:hypothetical protein
MRKNTRMPMRPYCCAAILLTVTAMVLVTPVIAADSSNPGAGRSASAIALDERVAAGDLKYRDSRTGEVVVATYAGIATLRQELAPLFGWPAGVESTTAADGTVKAGIKGAMRDVYLARTNLDGTRVRGCFRDLDSAVAFIVGLDEEHKRHADEEPRVTVVD